MRESRERGRKIAADLTLSGWICWMGCGRSRRRGGRGAEQQQTVADCCRWAALMCNHQCGLSRPQVENEGMCHRGSGFSWVVGPGAENGGCMSYAWSGLGRFMSRSFQLGFSSFFFYPADVVTKPLNCIQRLNYVHPKVTDMLLKSL